MKGDLERVNKTYIWLLKCSVTQKAKSHICTNGNVKIRVQFY